jgi:tetraacyldisaccharide 4'-kinase
MKHYLLLLLSKIYGFIAVLRLNLYKKNILKQEKLPCAVISIGNITAGGTGKTPMTIYLANFIKSLGLKPAILSRGYKGKAEKKGLIVSDGDKIFADYQLAGDEPYMMARSLEKISVIVGKNRFSMGMKAIEKFSPDVIILDDGFQHIKLKRDINILLLDSKNSFGNMELLPKGFLREPISSIDRADVFIFTRADSSKEFENSLYLLKKNIKKDIPIFKAQHIPYIKEIAGYNAENEYNFSILKNQKIIAFSGIAKNENFKHSLEKTGCNLLEFFSFKDHHKYIKADIEKILNAKKKLNAEYIVTTQKDFVKIKHLIPKKDNIFIIIDVKISFGEDTDAFNFFIKKRLKSILF